MCKQSNISLEDAKKLLDNPKLKKREAYEAAVPYRSEFERDCSRILYSSSFRRLQEKMQLIGVETAAFYRNRLTHSLEVQRVEHSIAHYLNKTYKKTIYDEDDISLLDAAALAHDIGHPAFGHKGERVLDEIAKHYGLRFEGNAQNYRVLRKLDRNSVKGEGLNLTYRTLLAINKYCNTSRECSDKFMYDEDYNDLLKIRQECKLGTTQTLDAQILELADDIAYATHDLEDGLCMSVTTLEELVYAIYNYSDKKNKDIVQERENAGRLFEKIITLVKNDVNKTNQVNQQQFMHLFRKGLTSMLIGEFVGNIIFDKELLTLQPTQKALCKILSKVTFRNVTRNTNVVRYEAKGEIVIKRLFNIYANERINKNYSLLPPDYQPKTNSRKEIARTVIDYIAGMSDTFAIEQYKQLTGEDFENINIDHNPEVYEIPNEHCLKSIIDNFGSLVKRH